MTTTTNEIPERKSIADQDKWNLEAVYPSFGAWQTAYDLTKSGIDSLKDYAGRLGEGSSILLEFIRKDEEVSLELNKL